MRLHLPWRRSQPSSRRPPPVAGELAAQRQSRRGGRFGLREQCVAAPKQRDREPTRGGPANEGRQDVRPERPGTPALKWHRNQETGKQQHQGRKHEPLIGFIAHHLLLGIRGTSQHGGDVRAVDRLQVHGAGARRDVSPVGLQRNVAQRLAIQAADDVVGRCGP